MLISDHNSLGNYNNLLKYSAGLLHLPKQGERYTARGLGPVHAVVSSAMVSYDFLLCCRGNEVVMKNSSS